MEKDKNKNNELEKFQAYTLAFEDLNQNAQKKLLEEASEKIFSQLREKNKDAEIKNISYSKTKNGEIVFDVETSKDGNNLGFHHEYYSANLEKIMEHNNELDVDIANIKRTDLQSEDEKKQFISEVESSKSRVEMKDFENEKDKNDNVNKNEENENSIQRKNDEIEESAKKLGIDSENLEINENNNDNGIAIDEKSKNLRLDDESVDKNIGKVAEMSADKKVTQHYTAKQLIGGDYKRYIVTKNNGNTQMLGQKEDGTIEKVENVEQVSPHTATIAGPNGKLETKSIQAGFNIKNRENDSGFGLNNDQELTYERAMNADTPIGYEMSEQMDKTKQAGYAQQLFDEINYKSTDMKDLADRKSEELRKEESPIGKTNPDIANGNPHVNEIESIAIPNQSNGIELLEIANKNNVSLEKIEELYGRCRSAGLYDEELILQTINNTLKKERGEELSEDGEQKDEKKEKNDTQSNDIDTGSAYIANDIEPTFEKTIETGIIGAMAINSVEQEKLNQKQVQEEITQNQEINQEEETINEKQEEFDLSDHGDGSPEDNLERTMEPKKDETNF